MHEASSSIGATIHWLNRYDKRSRTKTLVIYRSAWKVNSANFAITEFSEVRLNGILQRLAAILNHGAL